MSNKPDTINEETTAANSVELVDERSLKEKIYIIRGVQVMLDFELAEIYGYTTGKMNERVKDNAERFEGEEFRFQLTKDEYNNLKSEKRISSWGGRRTLPYAFTEQGIVNQQLLSISAQTADNTLAIKRIEERMVSHDDLSDFVKLFDKGIQNEEILILDGQPFKADVAYQKIYKSAKKSIIVIDDYIGVKTLHHLVHAKPGVKLTIISDNKLKILKLSDYNDFLKEHPTRRVDFIRSKDRTHDRYIVIDNDTVGMKIYHCGASSKDAGKRITTITRLSDVNEHKEMIASLLSNKKLILS